MALAMRSRTGVVFLPKSAGLAGWELELVLGDFLAGMGGSLGWGCLRPAREAAGDFLARPGERAMFWA